MKKAKTNYFGAFALLAIGAAGAVGITSYIQKTPDAQKVPEGIRREEANRRRHAPDVEASVQPDQQADHTIIVLTPESKNGDLTFTSKTESVPDKVEPIVFAVNRYLENTGFVDPKAKALAVQLKDGMAHIDVTEAFETSYGSLDERTVLQGLQRTMGQFAEVKTFAFYVSGKQVTTLGNADLTDPIRVIRAGEDAPAGTS